MSRVRKVRLQSVAVALSFFACTLTVHAEDASGTASPDSGGTSGQGQPATPAQPEYNPQIPVLIQQVQAAQKAAADQAEKDKAAAEKSSAESNGGATPTTSSGTTSGDQTASGDTKKEETDKKTDDDKKDGDKKADADKKDDDKKADADKTDADKKDGDKKADAEKKDGDKKADADKKDGDKKAEADKKDGDKKAEADKKAGDVKADADKKETKAPEVKEAYSPLKAAMFEISCGNYQKSLDVLNGLVKSEAKNAQVHYLMAISYVGLRKYPEATQHYQTVIQLSPKSKVGLLAVEGLKKITH